jgi:dipeptidyl aminopeptidase/acylaminoacyl peptidase
VKHDIGILSMDGEREWSPLIQEEYSVLQPRISPDEKWVAYTAFDKSSKHDIWVRPFPDVTKKQQISAGGGDSPLWSPDGQKLFYRNGDSVMMVKVNSSQSPDFIVEKPVRLFQGTYIPADLSLGSNDFHPWDLNPNDQRFLMIKEYKSGAKDTLQRINIVTNWFEELKDRITVH